MKTNTDTFEQYENVFLQFEQAWSEYRDARNSVSRDQQADVETNHLMPSVDEFFSSSRDAPVSVLAELSMIDLEHRLRQGLPTLTIAYQEVLSRLQSTEQYDDLLKFEFSTRHKFGCPPSIEELQSRFGERADQFLELLVDSKSMEAGDTVNQRNDDSVEGQPVNVESLMTPGTTFDHYRIERQIGRGTFAIVYRAIDTRLQRPVAIKFLNPFFSADGKFRERMLREAQTMASLEHPNIVAVLEIGQHRGFDFIVAKLVEGCDLSSKLSDHRYSIDESVELIRKLACAVDHAHQHGVIHRDIKPANVMISNDGDPLLLDFGLALNHDSAALLTNVGDIVGTPAFMPPEQADGRAWKADQRSDVYSLGVLLFRLVCHKLPFEGSPNEVLLQLVDRPPPNPRRLNPRVSHDLQVVILKCLEKEPGFRYQSAEELTADLNCIQKGLPISARPPGAVGKAVKWARRKPIVASLLGLLMLATMFAIGMGSQVNRIKSQRDRAQFAERQARNAEKELGLLLANEAAVAGQLAVQRGQLKLAIEYFDKSLAGKIEDPLRVRFLKLDALLAEREMRRAFDELQEILGDPKSESNPAQIAMWKGELALDGFTEFGDPLEQFEIARDLVKDDQATETYLDAMLAEDSVTALSGFQKTLKENSFHHRARRMRITILISLGRMEEARQEIRIAKELFPESEDFDLFLAIVFAHQGDLEHAKEILESLPEIDSDRWYRLCELVDHIASEVEISMESAKFQPTSIREAAKQFSKDCVPLIKERGWHFPPRIQKTLSRLPEILVAHRNDAEVEFVVASLKKMSRVHAEGSLHAIYIEALTAQQSLAWDSNHRNTPASGAEVSVEALKMVDHAKQLPAFIASTKEGDAFFEFTHAILLALVHKVDVEQNKARMIESATRMDIADATLGVEAIRAIVVGLLTIGAYEEAIPFADAWCERAGEDDFDSNWHRLMCDWHNNNSLAVIERYQEIESSFPDNQQMKDLHEAARGKLLAVINPEERSDE